MIDRFHLQDQAAGRVAKRLLFKSGILLLAVCRFSIVCAQSDYKLIAHRGGVVDEHTQENSKASIEKAIERGYWMVEMDVRASRDGVLIIHHDKNFKRYYNVDSAVDQMTWKDIEKLRSPAGGHVLTLEQALRICKGRIEVMIDVKLDGYDLKLFTSLYDLLKKYRFNKNALMIGTDESTPYFTGKIKLSCTRMQLEENKLRPEYRPTDFYLFSRAISNEDAAWAASGGILAVGAINAWAFKSAGASTPQQTAKQMKAAGLTHFQIDSEYEKFFK